VPTPALTNFVPGLIDLALCLRSLWAIPDILRHRTRQSPHAGSERPINSTGADLIYRKPAARKIE
jgi:hypothetical protein